MRKLMWFAIGFGAACAFCAYLWLTEGLTTPALAAAVLFVFFAIFSHHIKWLRVVAGLCMGCGVGLIWFQVYSTNYLDPAGVLDGETAYSVVQCTAYSYYTDYGTAVEGALRVDGKRYRTKLYLNSESQLEPGDVIQGNFRFRVTTPDGTDEATAHQGKGIFLLGYEEEQTVIRKPQQKFAWTVPSRLRHSLLEILDLYFPEDAAPFAKALLLGDRSGIDYKTDTAFKLSGISHVIAVSGLHVTILFTMIQVLCFKRRWLVALIGIPVLLLFAAAAGFSPSISRACLMQILMMVAALLGRDYDGPTELAFSCLVMLLVNPLVITSVSFQLSVGCMVGIFLFCSRIKDSFYTALPGKGKRFKKVKNWFVGSIAVTLSAMAATTPQVALYFGAVSLVGILTNLLTLWVVSFIFYGIMLVCLLSTFWAGAASILAAAIAWPIRYVLGVSRLMASFPLSAVYTTSMYIVLWIAFCYVLLAVFLAFKTKKPAVFCCCVVIGLCVALTVSWLEPLTDHCRMTVLDVGEGQSIVLQSEGKTFLVDCGGTDAEDAADIAAEYLLSQGIFRLDGVILTHFDQDHSGGMEYLLWRIPTDLLIVADCADEMEMLPRLLPHTERVIELRDNMILTYGDTKLSVFGPVLPDSDNESSLAILFRQENCDILITGDRSGFGERMLLKTGQIPEVDILVVGHHGSKDATSTELLQTAKPKTAVISVGENHYAHPAQEVLDRLKEINCTVYRTDLHGNIVIRR